jgi:hypothetical protein
MGLFGFDMDEFWVDCELATLCDHATLQANYDGWAVGAYMRMTVDIAVSNLK